MKIAPSKVNKVYWTHTLADIRTMLKLSIGWAQTEAVQNFSSFASVVSAALGGKSSGGNGDNSMHGYQYDNIMHPETEEDVEAALRMVFGG